jgi:4-oxalocrotonate tautomerase
MPILNVKVSATRSPETTQRIATLLLELTTRILHKDPNVTAIAIDYVHREAFDGFAALLGDLHEESYIYVQDVRAAAYGYGGRTQEWRYQHA